MPWRVALLDRSRRAAWAVPAALAAVLTGYLAWGAWESAHHPWAWFYLHHAWWRTLLRPTHDDVLLVVTALWLVSALSYWWPRRKQSQDVGLISVVAMVAIGAVLGTASLAPCRQAQTPSAVAAWVLSLYVGALEPRYGMFGAGASQTGCPGQLPLALQLGRTICLAATLVGALAAAAVLWRQPIGRLRARLVKDATILTGLDAMTIPLLRQLTSAGAGNHIVVIEPDGRHPLLDEARGTGAQVVVADPTSERVLMPMLRGLRGPQLRYLFALRPLAAENQDVLSAAKFVLARSRADSDRPPHLIARIDDPRHADMWRGQRIGQSSLWFEDALSPPESTACAALNLILRTEPRRVLLCGDSTLALAILLELAHRAWERQGLVEAAASGQAADPAAFAVNAASRHALPPRLPARVVLLDGRAADLRREFRATSPQSIVEVLPEVDIHTGAWRDQLLAYLDAMSPADAAETTVIIADSPTEAGMHEAGRVARLHAGTQVFVLSSDGAGVTGVPAFDRLQPFQRALLVDGEAPEDTWTRIARHWHECYRLAHPAVPGGPKERTRKPWADLDEFIREDNILQLRSIMAAVAALGRSWVPVRAVRPGSFVELSDSDLLRVASAEHSRWYTRRRAGGWRPASDGGIDDDNALFNRHVHPWAALPAAARAGKSEDVRSQIAQLEAGGFMPVLPDEGPVGAAAFQRSGGAAPCCAARQPGTGTPGGLTSARVDDGDVRAWRVDARTALRTMHGRAVAQPGDWIVQGLRRERWPVAAEDFSRDYRAAGPASP